MFNTILTLLSTLLTDMHSRDRHAIEASHITGDCNFRMSHCCIRTPDIATTQQQQQQRFVEDKRLRCGNRLRRMGKGSPTAYEYGSVNESTER